MGAIAGGGTAVLNGCESLVLADHQSKGVTMRASIVELSRCLLLAHERGVADDRRGEVVVPSQQVADRCQQPAVAMDILERHQGPIGAALFSVRDGTILHDSAVVVAPRGTSHPHRPPV